MNHTNLSAMQDGKISLFQSLFGRIGVSSAEVKVCTWLSVLITIGITSFGGVVEFTTDGVNFIVASLATIEHFANALPFSIFLCIIGLVIVHYVRGAKMLYSKKVRDQLIEEGRAEGRSEGRAEGRAEMREEMRRDAREWYEYHRGESEPSEPPPWERD